ncbi:SdpI family protein [Caloranaerobacter ferrireducens]|uniref:SdpI family protein n=1 Tax=Caloranaerobacter ferrireducens TaxID=1323370 RepID=UPI00084D8634|nr:SdpI family protein [Caloranaerobacter ferrireducens]
MKINKWILLILLISFIATIFIYSSLPDSIPRHWNIKGEIDAYGHKNMVFFTALLPIGLYVLMLLIPKIDPKRKSYLKHKKAYEILVVMIIMFLVIIHWISIFVALGSSINVGLLMKIFMGLLFIIIGNYMGQIRHNYFFGIRTPWTLANETVWRKTHRVGGYGFIAAGIVFLLSTFINNNLGFIIPMSTFILVTFSIVIYSYIEYTKIVK